MKTKTAKAKGEERAPSLENESTSQAGSSDRRAPKYAVPQGLQKQTDNVEGFWNPDKGPIDFIPREVRLSDSQIDPKKPSCLIIGELLEPCELTLAENEPVDGAKGDKVGVWYKPGMSAIKVLGGERVFMFEDGTQDTGKPSPMKLYEVFSAKKGKTLQVVADNRKESRNAPTAFTEAVAGGFRGEVPEGEI